jgi:hypothetical protein
LLQADGSAHVVSVTLEGLAAHTEYHYRLVASNEAGTEDGPGETFTTQAPSGAGGLPDGREYELVSQGTPVELHDDESGVFQALPVGGMPAPVAFDAATPDLQHIVLGAGEEATANVYESPGAGEPAGGAPMQVDILENGEPGSGDFLGGSRKSNQKPSEFAGRHAVSGDGSRVVWGNGRELFTRDMLSDETTRVDAAEAGCGSCAGGAGLFQLASSDGTRVFFTDASEVTAGAVAGVWEGEPAGSLYVYDVPEGKVRDLTAGGGVVDVLGGNEEGTVVYVVSSSVLTAAANPHGEEAVEGDLNIYMLRETAGVWSTAFVATLSASDEHAYNLPKSGEPHSLAKWPVRVSGDGEFLAFMSDRGLTGYDNQDAVSGVPDEEVFLYGAGAGSLVCASCDPSGARPVGQLDTGGYPGLPMDPTRAWAGHWLAAAIPGWNEAQDSSEINVELPLYESRVLSDSGRLFFDSEDALVPGDVNGREDVYEYEPVRGAAGTPSSDSCTSEAPVFGVSADGCVALVSSGQGSDDSVFVDASVSGDDVFFVTADRLVPADKDSAVDMYDAHVCSAAVPCLPGGLAASPACDSTDSCRAAQAIQPGVFGALASATFSGAGNLAPAPAPPGPSAKEVAARKIAAELARELKACKKKRSARKRAVCEAGARRRERSRLKVLDSAKSSARARVSVSSGGRGYGGGK